jgi:hypothetical protein
MATGRHGDVAMQMYAVELGKMGMDGFGLIECSNVLVSNMDGAKLRTVDLVRTRGVQIGATKGRLLGDGGKVIFEFP